MSDVSACRQVYDLEPVPGLNLQFTSTEATGGTSRNKKIELSIALQMVFRQ